MRRTPVAGLALVLLLVLAGAAHAAPVLVLDEGRARVREDPFLPPPEPTAPAGSPAADPGLAPPARPARAAGRTRTVPGELRALVQAGLVDPAAHDRQLATYARAKATLAGLRGARRAALGAVLANARRIAADGLLTPSRLPALMLTLERNRAWWAGGPPLAAGQRVAFAGSRLVWQHYAGQGLQIQWLGTFGKANGLFLAGGHDPELRALLEEALPLGSERAGGVAFEYLLRFGGGRPPWVSGLAQGTAVQALARAAVRLRDPRLFAAARAALGIFRTPPPAGVRVATPAGAHYLLYSFAPDLRVLNAFTQALNGLHDFAVFAGDAEGRALFAAGEAQLRLELPAYDTGAWSRYSTRREADVGYHRLARDFLRALCSRLTEDAGRPGGGPAPGADPLPACAASLRFTRYLSEPPRLRLLTRTGRRARPVSVRFTLDKPASVTLTVRRGGVAVGGAAGRFGSGRHALRWAGARRAGAYAVQLAATDPAGNAGAASAVIDVR